MTDQQKDIRFNDLNRWAEEQMLAFDMLPEAIFKIAPASDDASFRRYFRGRDAAGDSYIFVDAPPEEENSRIFVKIAGLLAAADIHVPEVYKVDFDLGFMMLSDLGSTLYLDDVRRLGSQQIQGLYQSAFNAMEKMKQIDCADLPEYDEALLRQEMQLFPDWFLVQQLGLSPDAGELAGLEAIFKLLVVNARSQPQQFVHRDYHSRNLMVASVNSPGVIDFQDAVRGPLTYDLVSLLKDCYWRFPRQQVIQWVRGYWQMMGIEVEFDEFLRWFDLMGAQRHLKCAGIFCRLNLRDGKPGYLKDIPQVLDYLLEVCDSYEQMFEFGDWLRRRVLPELNSEFRS